MGRKTRKPRRSGATVDERGAPIVNSPPDSQHVALPAASGVRVGFLAPSAGLCELPPPASATTRLADRAQSPVEVVIKCIHAESNVITRLRVPCPLELDLLRSAVAAAFYPQDCEDSHGNSKKHALHFCDDAGCRRVLRRDTFHDFTTLAVAAKGAPVRLHIVPSAIAVRVDARLPDNTSEVATVAQNVMRKNGSREGVFPDAKVNQHTASSQTLLNASLQSTVADTLPESASGDSSEDAEETIPCSMRHRSECDSESDCDALDTSHRHVAACTAATSVPSGVTPSMRLVLAAGAFKTAPSVIEARQLRSGARLLVQSTTTGRLLQVHHDGSVDFDGTFEHLTTFLVEMRSAEHLETVVCFRTLGCKRYLQCNSDGRLDGCGTSPDESACHFSLVDVLNGVVLFLGPRGTGHICARLGSIAPIVMHESPPQGFRLLAPAPMSR